MKPAVCKEHLAIKLLSDCPPVSKVQIEETLLKEILLLMEELCGIAADHSSVDISREQRRVAELMNLLTISKYNV